MKTFLQLVLAGIILYLVLLLIKGRSHQRKPTRSGYQQPEEMKKDPVCGTYVPQSQALKLTIQNRTCYFCSRECLEKYRKEGSGGSGSTGYHDAK
jgi:YHS domain-containing protein